jgi:arylsulfatase A-like enzyme
MDLLPTLAHLAKAALPSRSIDGHDIRPLIFAEREAKSPWDEVGFGYYRMDQLQAVRSGPWKLYLPLEVRRLADGRTTVGHRLELYDVRLDVHEDHEVSAEHSDIVERLLALAERTRVEIGDRDRPGKGQRPAGWVDNPRPLVSPK